MNHAGPVDVLLVEDDADIRETVAQVLDEDGYHVVGVAHGGEALAWLAQNDRPRVVLLDLMMPVMNGWEFRERQRLDPRLADIPVIILTAGGAARRDPKTADAAAFLLKPVELGDLLDTVARFARPAAGEGGAGPRA